MRQRVGKVFNIKDGYCLVICLVTVLIVVLFGFKSIDVFAADCKRSIERGWDEDNSTWTVAFIHNEGWNAPGWCDYTLQYWDFSPSLHSCTYQVINKAADTWTIDDLGWLVPPGKGGDPLWCDGLLFTTTTLPVFIDSAGDCYVEGVEGCMIASRAEDNVGLISKAGITLDIGRPPEPPSALTTTFHECTIRGNYIVDFHWDYIHLQGTLLDAYQIRMNSADSFPVLGDGSPDYTAPEFICDGDIICEVGGLGIPDGTNVDFILNGPNLVRWGNWLDGRGIFDPQTKQWGQTIYWQVRAKDANDLWSDWSTSASFLLPPHSYPWVDFVPPDDINLGDDVTFNDDSYYFDNNDPPDELACDIFNCSYSWDFPGVDGDPYNCVVVAPGCESEQDPVINFFAMPSSNLATSTVTDLDGYSCTVSKTIAGASITQPRNK